MDIASGEHGRQSIFLILLLIIGKSIGDRWLLPSPCSSSHASPWFFPTALFKNPPDNLWINAEVLVPITVVRIIIIIITAMLC